MLHSHYRIKEETIAIGDLDIRLLRITNIDELFDLLVAQSPDSIEVKDERIPYWADLWPSSIALSRFIVENNILSNAPKVLEIGCGLGLPGVVAGKLGARVTFTDYVEEPLQFAKQNWELNNSSPAFFQVLDWREIPDHMEADIVLASDVAYEKRSFEHLIKLAQKVTGEGKTLLLSEPGRKFAEPFIEILYDQQLVKRAVKYVIPLNGIENKVTVFELGK